MGLEQGGVGGCTHVVTLSRIGTVFFPPEGWLGPPLHSEFDDKLIN